MTGVFRWQGRSIPFHPGETVAFALARAGVVHLGMAATGQVRAVFCGIGQCQGCLVRADGRVTEACLLPAREDMVVAPAQGGGDD
jgi:D-hydroxyproline dehydrogenase subunit gamma